MLVLDLDKIDESHEEFVALTNRLFQEDFSKPLAKSITQLGIDIEEIMQEAIESDDPITEEASIRTILTFMMQFWLENKESFLKMDRIVSHFENVPMKWVEEEDVNRIDI